MAIFSYMMFAIVGVVFFMLGIFFILVIAKNVRQGKVVREQLAKKIDSLRMSKMFRALGLDVNQYLYNVPLAKVSNNMNNCENCNIPGQCDEKLQPETIKPEEIGFCPNHESFKEFNSMKSQS